MAANVTTAMFGMWMSVVNAFLFIGLDLTSRDRLHEAWKDDDLWLKMGTLIASGSVLSWFINRNAGQIALASFVSFVVVGVVDTVVYHWLYKHGKTVRVNGSNVLSAAVDSVVFPTLAFGGIQVWVTLGQFVAKVVGGWLWSKMLIKD